MQLVGPGTSFDSLLETVSLYSPCMLSEGWSQERGHPGLAHFGIC